MRSTSRNISSLIGSSHLKVYSCRVRREGPDYRTFVTNDQEGWKCFHKKCSSSNTIRSRSTVQQIDCKHITSLKLEYGDDESESDVRDSLKLSQSKLEELAVPERYRKEIDELLKKPTPLIQRVSAETFAVRALTETQEHPLGLLHVHLQQRSVYRKDLKQQIKQSPSFLCSCRSFQSYQQSTVSTSKPSRRCVHFYICVWAILSDENLSKEFPIFMSTKSSRTGI